VGPWVKGGGEDKAQLLQASLWVEELFLKLPREGAWHLIAPGSSPVDQFGLWNGEGNINRVGLSLQR